ncbi:type VII secretion target [Nocardioides acrostichi]|uniref:Excreted virulence factor EspC, type VII ESX diderm n=1 Tax=Nocardioides acrostichi TaxID=2784339 RepID=A0A930V0B3_9ACTN|nr:type VII secretion target [Nocardioides acrostichi]MBF4161370.1 hypothetical protein [Nocardioides acrostichi]
MDLGVDTAVVARGGDRVNDLAHQLGDLVHRAETAVREVTSTTGHDDLARTLASLLSTMEHSHRRVVESLTQHAQELHVAAQAYERIDAELGAAVEVTQ